jgi:hypothetical protein
MKSILTALLALLVASNSYADWIEQPSSGIAKIFRNSDRDAKIKEIAILSSPSVFDGGSFEIHIGANKRTSCESFSNILIQAKLRANCWSSVKMVQVTISRSFPEDIDMFFDQLNTFEPIEPGSMLNRMKDSAHEVPSTVNPPVLPTWSQP